MKCCDLHEGMLDRRVEILKKQKVPNGSGGFITVLVPLDPPLNPYAKIKPMSGGEKVHADRLNAQGMARVYIRFTPRIDETMAMRYDGRTHNIRSYIDIEERHEWGELLVERGVAP